MRDHRCQHVPGTTLGWAAVDDRVAARLHSILGLGQSVAFVRCRGASGMRGIVVGEFLAVFQPGGQLSGGGNPLVHRCWVALRYRTLSLRWNGIDWGWGGPGLG